MNRSIHYDQQKESSHQNAELGSERGSRKLNKKEVLLIIRELDAGQLSTHIPAS